MTTPVQTASTGAGSNGTAACSFASSPVVGNAVIVIVSSNSNVVSTLADNQTAGANVFTAIKQQPANSYFAGGLEIWWCPALTVVATGTYTVNVTQTANGQHTAVSLMEVAGLASVDKSAGAETASGTSVVATASTANTSAIEFVVGATGGPLSDSGDNLTLTSSYTQAAYLHSNVTGIGLMAGYKTTAVGETSAATGTWATASRGCAIVASFQLAAAASSLQIKLDDPARVGGSSQVFLGTGVDDNTGDPLRTGGTKFKMWAADLNTMLTNLFDTTVTNGDANLVMAAGTQQRTVYFNATLTANRTCTLPATGLTDGQRYNIVRRAATPGAFTLTISDPVSGKSEVIGSGSNGFSQWRAVSATEYVCTAHGTYT